MPTIPGDTSPSIRGVRRLVSLEQLRDQGLELAGQAVVERHERERGLPDRRLINSGDAAWSTSG